MNPVQGPETSDHRAITLRARGLEVLARRSLPGTWFPGMAYLIVGLLAGIDRRAPALFWLGFGCGCLSAFWRFRLSIKAQSRITTAAETWLRHFRLAVLVPLAMWSCLATAIVVELGLGPVTSLALLASAGLAGAGLHIFCAYQRLA